MDPHRRSHRRLLNNRQGLGVIGGLFPSSSPSSAASQSTPSTSQSTSDPGGIIGGITSLIGGISTHILPSSAPSSTATSSTPLTHSSSSSTGSTPTSATISTSSTSSASTVSPTSTPTPTTSAPDIVYTSSDGTSVVYVTSTLPAASATAAPPTSFLQNPSLEGGVFALVGIVALIIIFVIITWTIRKRRRNRLERDLAAAVTFDPGATDLYERQEDSIEKHRLSGSSSGHVHGHGLGYGMAYATQQEYHGPMGYAQYPAVAAYRAPSPNLIPYQIPSPAIPQPAAQGGANLTRKFSDRKPVPPLLPDPAYDPANVHVPVHPQFHQQ